MKIVVDANITFSAILNSNGKIGDLLLNSKGLFSFIAPDFLRTEIYQHRKKLLKLSGLTAGNLYEAEFQIFKSISFISEKQISENNWIFASNLVADIDAKDIVYVAFAKQFCCKLWTGDKKLINGLVKKGYDNIVNTNDLYLLRQSKFYLNL